LSEWLLGITTGSLKLRVYFEHKFTG